MNRTTSFATRVVAAAVVLVGGSVSLAYAGVDLPGTAAERAMEKVLGVDLPNQATEDHGKPESDELEADDHETGGKSVSEDVHEVIDGSDEHGCEFGQEVAETARANSQSDDAGAEDPCDHGKADEDHGKAEEDHGKAEEDHGKADDPQGKAEENHGKADDPQGKAEENHGKTDEDHGKTDEDQGSRETGQDKSKDHSNAADPKGSRETGEEHSSDDSTDEEDTEASGSDHSQRPDEDD